MHGRLEYQSLHAAGRVVLPATSIPTAAHIPPLVSRLSMPSSCPFPSNPPPLLALPYRLPVDRIPDFCRKHHRLEPILLHPPPNNSTRTGSLIRPAPRLIRQRKGLMNTGTAVTSQGTAVSGNCEWRRAEKCWILPTTATQCAPSWLPRRMLRWNACSVGAQIAWDRRTGKASIWRTTTRIKSWMKIR